MLISCGSGSKYHSLWYLLRKFVFINFSYHILIVPSCLSSTPSNVSPPPWSSFPLCNSAFHSFQFFFQIYQSGNDFLLFHFNPVQCNTCEAAKTCDQFELLRSTDKFLDLFVKNLNIELNILIRQDKTTNWPPMNKHQNWHFKSSINIFDLIVTISTLSLNFGEYFLSFFDNSL